MTYYTIIDISVDPFELCEHNVEVATTFEGALEKFNIMHNNWKQMKKDKDNDEEITEEWFSESLSEDLENNNYKLLHYVYDGGLERIFSLEKHELE